MVLPAAYRAETCSGSTKEIDRKRKEKGKKEDKERERDNIFEL